MILTVTLNPAVDHTVTLDETLEPNTIHRTSNRRFDPGGKGINVSQFLAELERETVATGLAGGRLGGYIEHALTESGLENEFVEIDGISRLNTTILANGEEYKINQSGPPVSIQRVSELIEVFRQYHPDTVVIGGSLPQGLGSGAIDYIAGAGNWRTVVDGRGEVLDRLEKRYALAAPNRNELATATGMAVDSVNDCLRAGRALRETGYERVLVSLGSDGALLVGPRGDFRARVPKTNEDAIDTTGAGDALLAGVLAGIHGDDPAERALARGVAVASRSVAASGTSVPDLSGIDGLVRKVDVEECSDRSETPDPDDPYRQETRVTDREMNGGYDDRTGD